MEEWLATQPPDVQAKFQQGLGIGNGSPGQNPRHAFREELGHQASNAGAFANQGEAGYGALSREAQGDRELQRKIATGELSYSKEQLRQALQQNMGVQQSMAAGASPQNAAASARTAQMQAANMGAGLAGQQASAGIAERMAATEGLNRATLGARQQDLQAALQSRQNQLGALGQGFQTQTQYDIAQMQEPEGWEKVAGVALGGANAFARKGQ